MNEPETPGSENPETAHWEPRFPVQSMEDLSPEKLKPIVELYDEWHLAEPDIEPLDLTNDWYDVTPQMAERWLRHNPPGANRKLSLATVKHYARQMKAGNWPKTGQTIVFDKDGVLKDAQHRLWACLLSGASFPTFVVADVPPHPKLFAFLDGGKSRTLADALQTGGYNGVSATIKQILSIENEIGGYTSGGEKTRMPRMTPLEILDMVERHPTAVTAARLAAGDWDDAVRVVGYRDVVGFVGMQVLDLHGQEVADDFLGQVGFVNDPDPTEAVAKFRKLMAENPKKQKPLKKHQILGNLIRCFNYWLSGADVPKRWVMQPPEDFPMIAAPATETVDETAEAAQ